MFTHAQLLVIADALNDRAEQIEDQVNSDALDPRDVAYLRTSIDELIDALTAVHRELDNAHNRCSECVHLIGEHGLRGCLHCDCDLTWEG